MNEPPRPGDFAYVHSDIPPGMTIGEWRAQRAANRPTSDRPALRACSTYLRAAVVAAWRAMAQALGRPRFTARSRARRPASGTAPGGAAGQGTPA